MSIDRLAEKKYLMIWALNGERMIEHQHNPITMELHKEKERIKYEVSDSYYYSDLEKVLDLLIEKPRVGMLSEYEIDLIETTTWRRKFTHGHGGFWFLPGHRITNLAKFASSLGCRGLIKDIIGLPVELSIELELDTAQKGRYLVIKALGEDGRPFNDPAGTIIFKIETKNKKLELQRTDRIAKRGIDADEYVFKKPEREAGLEFAAEYLEIYHPGKKIYYVPGKNLHPEWINHTELEVLAGTIKSFDGNFIEIEGVEGVFAIGFVSENKEQLLDALKDEVDTKTIYG